MSGPVVIRYRDAGTTSDFVYLRGEPIYDKSTGEFAVGDGVTPWSALPKFVIGGGGLVDGSYGDVTISGGGTVMTVTSGAITLAKMADLAPDRIIGRANGAGTGVPTALTATQLKAILALAIADVAGLQAALDTKAAATRTTGVHYAVKQPSGTEVSTALTGTAATTIAGAAGRLECFPFIPCHDITINRLALEVATGGASATFRIGIYSDVSGVPTTLLCGGVTDHDGATSSTDRTEAVTLTMSAGTVYWFAVHSSSTAQFRGTPVASCYGFAFSIVGAGGPVTSKRATATYASGMPATAPAMTNTAGAILPLLRVRIT